MATVALAAAGSALAGGAATAAGAASSGFLATAAASLGGTIGSQLGGMIDDAVFGTTQKLPDVVGQRLADTSIQVSTYGAMIPIVYGRTRLAGNIIWSNGIQEVDVSNTSEQSSGGKGGGSKVSQTAINYEYYVTLAIAICEGEIDEVTRVWADSKPLGEDILSAVDDKYNVHLGSETQLADTIIESYEGSGNVPGYRGIAYVVIKDFPLSEYGNRIPNFTFEVVREVKRNPSVEDLVKEIVIIPGSGEFVYETNTIEKQSGLRTPDGTFVGGGTTTQMNMHNFDNVADVIKSLDNLQQTFPNLEKVNLVVTWYSTSKFLASSTIIPKVENNADDAEYTPYDWEVAGLDRATAETITVLDNGDLNFGGTPSDKSVLNLCVELQSRGLEVMFYPFLAIDTDGTEGGGEEAKPWRGRMIPTSAAECNNWFTKSDGYNDYIEHYANLTIDGVNLKDNIDKFVIGSEMVGLTQYSSSTGVFPAVTNFISLAATIKTAVGSGVEVGYAADWSEYHSTGGWFNMDPLWTDSNIDFIGIDYYMPLTPDLAQTSITQDLITQYIEDGEGWEYFWNSARTVKTDYTPNDGTSPYAWKNIEGWWKASSHTNPDSSNNWSAKAKKIIFTEYGFPSVDACSNQPNVFIDPNSVESFYPRSSKRRVDFNAQRESITAMLEFWQAKNSESGNSDLVPEMYLWTWDARPFPFFPDLNSVWSDGSNWKTGHWVNGKLGGSNLGSIVENLLQKVGFTSSDYDTSQLDDLVDGYINTRLMTIRDWLNQLQSTYFFDMVESDGKLKFIKRGGSISATISESDLVPVKQNSIDVLLSIDRKQELELPKQVSVTFLDRSKDYQNNTQTSQRQTVSSVNKEVVNVPIVMSAQEGKIVSDIRLYNLWVSRNTLHFILSNEYINIEPTDLIDLTVNGVTHTIRISETNIGKNGELVCTGFSEDVASYDFYTPPGESENSAGEGNVIPTTDLILLDLPLLPGEIEGNSGTLRAAASPSNSSNWNGSLLYRSDDGGESLGNTWNIVGNNNTQAVVGTTLTNLDPGESQSWDVKNTVDVYMKSGESKIVSSTDLGVLNGANACVINGEIIQFKTAVILDGDPKKLRLSDLLRGRLGTETEAETTHNYGSDFVLLTKDTLKVEMPLSLFGVSRYYKPVSVGSNLSNTDEQSFSFEAVSYKPYSPVHLEGVKNVNDWDISWVRRTRTGGELLDNLGTVPLNEEVESYEIDVMDGSSVVNTYTSSVPSFTYTSAQQIDDWGSNQSTIELNIYQISAVIGRGKSANKTFS